jgi:hypothetical protein
MDVAHGRVDSVNIIFASGAVLVSNFDEETFPFRRRFIRKLEESGYARLVTERVRLQMLSAPKH